MFQPHSTVARWLWTHNPFYVISALLMLYAVRASYGEINIGAINCWVMMGVLAAYTLVLASVGVLIVRWGRVWDDARSIFLVLLLLFLAVSVSADDLFVNMTSSSGGAALLLGGFAFSIAVTASVLRGTGIRLGAAFQIPFLLFLALFYVTPWWCSPELHPQDADSLDWTVFLFPQVAALLCLTLLPAARLGSSYVANNGTPWSWPWFPWVAFGVIGIAVALRSYALTLTFSQTGPIWVSADSRQGIVLDTIWRPYFLVPFLLAALVLALEAGLVSRSQNLIRRTLAAGPAILLMAFPWGDSPVTASFLARVTNTIGSPIWLTIWLLILFYGWAMVRRVPHAELGCVSMILLLSIVGPRTVSLATMMPAQPLPVLVVASLLIVTGIRRRSSTISFAAMSLMTAGLWLLLPHTIMIGFRMTTCYHVMLASCLLLSLTMRDRFAMILRHVGAMLLSVSSLLVLTAPMAAEVPLPWRLLYVLGLAGVCFVCAQLSRSGSYWMGFIATSSLLGYGMTVVGFRQAASVVGRDAMTAFSWSIAALLIGTLISAYKANWLPPHLWPKWLVEAANGGGGTMANSSLLIPSAPDDTELPRESHGSDSIS